MKHQSVSEIMKREMHCVDADRRVSEVAREMYRLHVGAVMVKRGAEMAGIFTERDLLNRVVGVGTDPASIPVSAVMTAKFMTVSPDATVEVAAFLMHKRGFRHLPVKDETGAVVGILSVRDVLAVLAPEGGVPTKP